MKKRGCFILISLVLCLLSACSRTSHDAFFPELDSSQEEAPGKPLEITTGFARKDVARGDGLTLLAVLEDEV